MVFLHLCNDSICFHTLIYDLNYNYFSNYFQMLFNNIYYLSLEHTYMYGLSILIAMSTAIIIAIEHRNEHRDDHQLFTRKRINDFKQTRTERCWRHF